MKLLTKEIREKMPAMYSQDGKPKEEQKIVCKFFTPDADWTFYVLEGEPRIDDQGNEYDFEFFGLVTNNYCPAGEYGYFVLSEIKKVRGAFGLPIERDLHFEDKTTADVLDEIKVKH